MVHRGPVDVQSLDEWGERIQVARKLKMAAVLKKRILIMSGNMLES